MNLKKIAWVLSLLLILFIGDRIGGSLLQIGVENSQFRYARMYKGEAAASMLFIGNSRGLGFYQPYIEEITNKKTFNLSYNGMTMDVAQALIYDYLERYDSTQILFIDVTMCDHKNQTFTNSFAPYISYSDNLSELIHENDLAVFYALQISHLFRYNNEVYQRTLYYNSRSDKDWLLDRKISQETMERVADKKYRIDLHYVEKLKETIDFAEKKGVKVVLLINPYYVPFSEILEGLDSFKTQIETHTKHQVYDFSAILKDATFFGDYQHLNQKGSRAYADWLKEKGLFNF